MISSVYNILFNTEYEDSPTIEEIKRMINKSVNFLCSELGLNSSLFNLDVLIPQNYIVSINNNHYKATTDNANAMFIPWFQSKNRSRENKDVIIVNWPKIQKSPFIFKVSVLIHELMHYLDYLNCDQFSQEFNLKFDEDHALDSKEDYIIGYFNIRSEFRAKYRQEQFICINIYDSDCFIERVKKQLTPIRENSIHYDLAHARAQIKCWKDWIGIEENDPNLYRLIISKEKYLDKRYPPSECKNVTEIFEWNDFIVFCKKLETFMNIIVMEPTETEKTEMRKKPIWECKVSEFDWYYDNEERCLLIEGEVEVIHEGLSVSFGAGDMVVFPKGLSCVWKVKKPVKKHYIFK